MELVQNDGFIFLFGIQLEVNNSHEIQPKYVGNKTLHVGSRVNIIYEDEIIISHE